MQAYVLAKTWHKAQVFSAPTTYTRQLTTAIAWYIWTGGTFRAPISTLQNLKRQVGRDLIDVEAKCRALLIGRTWTENMKKSSPIATLIREWNLDGPRANPPNIGRMPIMLEYLYSYTQDRGYTAHPGNVEGLRTFKLRVYNTQHTMAASTRESREMRIKQLHPDTRWMQVWEKLHST